MRSRLRTFSPTWVAVLLGLALSSAFAFGCSSPPTTTYSPGISQPGAGPIAGKLYIAVTGASELTSGSGNMGMAIVDLTTRKVEMVNLTDARAPQGIIFGPDSATAPGTSARTSSQPPATLYLGNAQDGTIDVVDLAARAVKQVIKPPGDARLQISGMYAGPDGRVYLASIADGRVYALDNGSIKQTAVGGGETSSSISSICWSADGKTAYLTNMLDAADPNMPGYIAKVEWPSGRLMGKIANVTSASPSGSQVALQSQTTPDGRFLYIPDAVDRALIKIDLSSDQVVKRIPLSYEPASIVFSSSGQIAYVTVRHAPAESMSGVLLYDVAKDQVIDQVYGIPAPIATGIVLEQD